MYLSKVIISGFRSFGTRQELLINERLVSFIGLNSCGKTTAMEALRKMFGSSASEKELCRHDFHITNNERFDEIDEKLLHIEVKIEFDRDEEEAIPHFFEQMVIDSEGENPYLRIRLEGKWIKSNRSMEGDIDNKLFFITVGEGEEESEEDKQAFPNHLRSLIQIFYVPAIRKPTEQIKYASGSILYRVLRRINWPEDFEERFKTKIEEVNQLFKNLPEFKVIEDSLKGFWKKFHRDLRYHESEINFSGSDFESILKKLEISFSPTEMHRKFTVDELGDGYRSLFYLTLACSLLDVEDKLNTGSEEIGIHSPLLTILLIEEPENHIAPQLLGRVINVLRSISLKGNSQVFLSSHTPSIVKRLKPESIIHFRSTENYETEVNSLTLPEVSTDAYKYIKEAVYNYPEIYFAKLVIIGEGDSEEVIFNRLTEIFKVNFDDNIITFAPLGHRFVNHIWRLLKNIHIPYITLLDLDVERDGGGGWGRIKYALTQLIQVGYDSDELLNTTNGVLSEEELNNMHKRTPNLPRILSWVSRLQDYNVYYSSPLDLDFLMLFHYPIFYKAAIPEGGGPRIPDKGKYPDEYKAKLEASIQSTLKSEKATGESFTAEEKELMIWYNYHFLGRGKPVTHLSVLSKMSPRQIRGNIPPVFTRMFEKISELLEIKTEGNESNQ